MKNKCAAIVLAAGRGKRMNQEVAKQYLQIEDKPILYYALAAFQKSFVEEIILVTAKEDIAYCKKEIVERFHLDKVSTIVEGGRERYHSVYAGLAKVKQCEYVFIHDGARPFLTKEIIERTYEGARDYQACVAGMPVKDTIKVADASGFAAQTPVRSRTWMIQTPQVFLVSLIQKAYEELIQKEEELLKKEIIITDDAMVVEYFTDKKVKLIQGSYENIKITTPEDLCIAEILLKNIGKY